MSEAVETSETLENESMDETPVVCQFLRTKTAFGTFAGSLHSWQAGNSTTAVYWCLRTMETAGPDDGYAHPHACRPGRECFSEPEE
jgi:hypothetical protein